MRMFDIRSLLVIAVVAASSSTLLGCPDKASPDPAAAKGSATAASTAPVAPKAGASAAAPAKSGGW